VKSTLVRNSTVTHRQSELDTGVQQDVTHRRFERGTGVESTQTKRIVRPQRVRRPPARYRQLYHDRSVGIQSGVATNVSVAVEASQHGQRPRAADGSRLQLSTGKRAGMSGLCDRPPVGDITTFRRHMFFSTTSTVRGRGTPGRSTTTSRLSVFVGVIDRADRDSVKNSRVDNRHSC
jgi:hypothetical protein